MHAQSVRVWCIFWDVGITGTDFFDNEDEKVATVNEERYRTMIDPFYGMR